MEFELSCYVVENFPSVGDADEHVARTVINVIEVANGAIGSDGMSYLICKIEYNDASYQLMAIQI